MQNMVVLWIFGKQKECGLKCRKGIIYEFFERKGMWILFLILLWYVF